MKLKLTPEGHAIVVDGKPIYVHDDGKEIPFDAPATVSRISALNLEAKTRREAFEKAEAALKLFEGLDPEAARKAVDTVKNIDDKKLVDSGKIDEVRAAAVKAYEERLSAAERAHALQLEDVKTKLNNTTLSLHNEVIGGSFARSPYIAENFAADGPAAAEIAKALFGNRFKVEDGKIAAFDAAGNRIHSRVRPGDVNVDFDEAMEILVDAYPHKNSILKPSGSDGGGAASGYGSGSKVLKQEQFDALRPVERAKKMADGFTVA